jgi:3-oxoadipate CoA-transferase alpha subunit
VAVNKAMASFDEAVADIPDGALVGISNFAGAVMTPQNLISAVARKAPKNLTIVTFFGGLGVKIREFLSSLFGEEKASKSWYMDGGVLVEQGIVRKVISSFPFAPGVDCIKKEWDAGKVMVEEMPHGNLAVRLWAAGAGAGGVYVRTGVGTVVEDGKEKKVFEGEEYILERPLKLDFALIRAHKADKFGNLIYQGVGRGSSALMAKAATVTIAEVDEVVEPGKLDPEHIITPGIYVRRVVQIPKES